MRTKQLLAIAFGTVATLSLGDAMAQSSRTPVKEWREGDYIVRQYIVTDNEPHTAEYEIFYAINRADMSADYEHNDRVLERLDSFFAELQRDTMRHIKSITITGYASPDGTTTFNSELARQRAQQLGRLMEQRYNIGNKCNIALASHVEPWSATASSIERSSLQNRDDIVRMVNAKEPAMTIDLRLKKQDAAWNYLTSDVLPDMRRSLVEITYIDDKVSLSREYSPAAPEVIIVEEEVIEAPRPKRHKRKVEVVNEWDGVIIDLGAASEGYEE